MDLNFNVERLMELRSNLDRDRLEATVGKAFLECLEKAHLYFHGSLDLDCTDYMTGEIATAGDAPKTAYPKGHEFLMANQPFKEWTAEGKTHEQMLREKMAMHNGFPMPEPQPKRRGRRPKAQKGDA